MHPGVIASRKGLALQRSKEAVRKLAKKYNLDIDAETLTPVGRDPVVLDMLKAEAMADILEALSRGMYSGNPEPQAETKTKKGK